MPGPAPIEVEWSSERRLRLAFAGDGPARVLGAYRRLAAAALPGVIDLVPAYRTLHVEVSMPAALGHAGEALRSAVRALADADASPDAPGPLVEIPVCYDPELGPDLAEVAALHGLTPDAAAALHASAEYTVRFVGFSPGFPYLSGLPARLATPRLATPRVQVPAGSVAIAADQAGIYPRPTAGGWRILGRTPVTLFDPLAQRPARLTAGDRVRFVPISRREFDAQRPGGSR